MPDLQPVFRPHIPSGLATDVYEDDAAWVRDAETLSTRDLADPDVILEAPRDVYGLKDFLTAHRELEGVLFVHDDGREAAVTRAQLGL
jgi:hypothetical protein